MKTTKSLLYGLLLVTGLAACSKEYNSSPGANGNAFGGTNPVAPITGAAAGEMVFKENGATVRLKGVVWVDDGARRRINGAVFGADGSTINIGYTIEFRYYNNGQNVLDKYYDGSGKVADSVLIYKITFTTPGTLVGSIQYYSGALSVNVPGYASAKVTDTAKSIMKGEFSGRLARRDFLDANKDYPGDFIDLTSGFFNAKMLVP